MLGHGLRLLLRVLLLVVSGWAGTALSARAADWTVVKYAGRDYVTLKNVADFYHLDGVLRVSNNVTASGGSHALRGQVGSPDFIINNLKFILSYPVEDYEGQPIISRMDLVKVIDPIMRPSRIPATERVDTVVLDPGHGGHDNGAVGPYGAEKTYALDVALRTRTLLQAMGLKVVLTRTDDTFIPLEDRCRFANRFRNALFIAIHFNSGQEMASGVETYTLAPRGVPSMAADGPRLSDLNPCPNNVNDPENMALACAMHAALVSNTQLFDRGIKRARFVVIRDITVPGVLVEGGFLSNAGDSRRIATVEYRNALAAAIARAVRNYRSAVGQSATMVADAKPAESPAAKVKADFNPGPIKSNGPVVITPTAR